MPIGLTHKTNFPILLVHPVNEYASKLHMVAAFKVEAVFS